MSSTTSLTLEAWFKRAPGPDWMAIIGKGTTDNDEEYTLMVKETELYFDVGKDVGPYLQLNAEIKLDTWHHVAAVHSRNENTSELKLFLDGEEIGSSTQNSIDSPNDNNHPVTIGSRFSSGIISGFKGQIDDVRIWNYALSQEDIISRRKIIDPNDPLWSNLSGYYRMDWGAGNTAFDYSRNANHGITSGNPDWMKAYSWERGMVSHLHLNGNGIDILGNHKGDVLKQV